MMCLIHVVPIMLAVGFVTVMCLNRVVPVMFAV